MCIRVDKELEKRREEVWENIPVHYNILTDKEIAEKAHGLITSDLSVYATVEELAEKIGCSAFKLRTAFKKYHTVSLSKFSRRLRMDKAKELLTGTNYPLQTIAEMVGFEEGNNFQISFKTVVGVTPGAWRRGAE